LFRPPPSERKRRTGIEGAPPVIVSGQTEAFRAEEKRFEDASLPTCYARHGPNPWLKRSAHRPKPQRHRRRWGDEWLSAAPLLLPGCMSRPCLRLSSGHFWPHL